MFGGNSNWRGPIWFPLNYLLVSSIKVYGQFFGDSFTVEYPTGSGEQQHARRRSPRISARRLISLFLRGRGRPPPVLRRGRPAAARSTLAGPRAVQRVLPRRQRRRARRLAPDRLDRRRRRPDPPGPRLGGRLVDRPAPARRRDVSPPAASVLEPERGRSTHPRCRPGRPYPLGATPTPDGTNFAVASEVGRRHDPVPLRRRTAPSTASRWTTTTPACGTCSSPASAPGSATAIGPPARGTPARGVRCNETKLLLDPYARAITGEVTFGPAVLGHAEDDPDRPSQLDSAGSVPLSLVIDPTFDWGDDAPLARHRTPTRSSTSCTRRGSRGCIRPFPPSSKGRTPASATRRSSSISSDLGVTAVELLPVHHSVPEAFLVAEGLTNYWGYNTIGYFAPARGLLRRCPPGRLRWPGATSSSRWCGRCTPPDSRSSSTWCSTTPPRPTTLGPTLCHRGLDNPAYYRLEPGDLAPLRRHHGVRELPQRRPSRSRSSSSWTRCATGSRRCTSTASASTSPPRSAARTAAYDRASVVLRSRRPGPGGVAGQADRRTVGRRARATATTSGASRRCGASGTASIGTPSATSGGAPTACSATSPLGSPAPPTSSAAPGDVRRRRSTSSRSTTGSPSRDLVSYDAQAQRGQPRGQPGRQRRQPFLEQRRRRTDGGLGDRRAPTAPGAGDAGHAAHLVRGSVARRR